MSTLRKLACLCSLAGGLMLALTAGPALAAPHGLQYNPGPTTVVMPIFSYYQVIAQLTNTGENADTFHLTVTKDIPDDWTLSVCYGGVCYTPDLVDFIVPETGTLAPGETTEVDLDITTLVTEGPGTYTINITSNSDPSYDEHVTYTVLPLSDAPVAFTFAPGANILPANNGEVVRFHTALFNTGMQDDSYTLTVTRDMPLDWSATVCYDGICYPPSQTDFTVPVTGVVASGGFLDFDLDFTPLFTTGAGSMTLNIASNTDGAVVGSYTYYVSTEGLVGVEDMAQPLLSGVQATPNPFNPRTEIRFAVGGDHALPAAIDIYDVRGQKVRTLDAGLVAPGSQSVSWDGRDGAGDPLGTGVYLAKVQVGAQTQTVKMSLVK